MQRITNAALAGISPERLVAHAFARAEKSIASSSAYCLVAAGKAAVHMTEPFLARMDGECRAGVVTIAAGVPRPVLPKTVALVETGHPTPTVGSAEAASAALALAEGLRRGEHLIVLLSGGASAMLAAPAAGVTLEDKMGVTRALLHAGVGIAEINCVRKHVSAVKGGRLAAAAAGRVTTWAISDIVAPLADDPSVIGSGPTVADPTTFADALAIAQRVTRTHPVPPAVLDHLARGVTGVVPETPKPGDRSVEHARFELIGTRHHALAAARVEAAHLGYHVIELPDPVVGEAREAVVPYWDRVRAAMGGTAQPICVISAGETTVTVRGGGKGGRNQEFALALAPLLARERRAVVCGSAGTDGIDGPTDAAGAVVDNGTISRGQQLGCAPAQTTLDNNDAYTFFQALGDLIHTGPTGTNVADIQVTLVGGTIDER